MGLTRAFVALGLPDPICDTLARIGEGVPAGRPVDADNLHVTLVFLGERDDGTLEEVHDALSSIRIPELNININGLGQFGGDRPRSLWAGVEHTPDLTHLQGKVAQAVRTAGVEIARRRFVPHVTLSRLAGMAETPEFQRYVASHAGLSLGPVHVQSFGLYASYLGRGGAIYEEMAAYPLDDPGRERIQ